MLSSWQTEQLPCPLCIQLFSGRSCSHCPYHVHSHCSALLNGRWLVKTNTELTGFKFLRKITHIPRLHWLLIYASGQCYLSEWHRAEKSTTLQSQKPGRRGRAPRPRTAAVRDGGCPGFPHQYRVFAPAPRLPHVELCWIVQAHSLHAGQTFCLLKRSHLAEPRTRLQKLAQL